MTGRPRDHLHFFFLIMKQHQFELIIGLTHINKYNPKSEKVGTVWKTQIKKESSDF